jgi:hypothetical protein
MGLAPAAAEIGDKIRVFFGGQLLYTSREQTASQYEFVNAMCMG